MRKLAFLIVFFILCTATAIIVRMPSPSSHPDDYVNYGRYSKVPRITRAVLSGDIDKIHHLIELGADINKLDVNETSPLSHAIQSQQYDIATFLLEKGADPNPQTVGGDPLLVKIMIHQQNGNPSSWQFFLDYLSLGANPSDSNAEPLVWAAAREMLDHLDKMLRYAPQHYVDGFYEGTLIGYVRARLRDKGIPVASSVEQVLLSHE